EQPRDRHLAGVRVGQAIGRAQLHGRDRVVEVVDRVGAPRAQVVAFEDVQRLQHLEGRERRRHRIDLLAAIRDRRRLAPLRLELRQVLLAEPAARLADGARNRLRDRPAVENLGAALGDLAERRRELLVGHHTARARPAVAEVEPLGLPRPAEGRARRLEELDVLERQRHPALGGADGRRQHARAVHGAEALEGGQPAAEVAGRRARLRPARQVVLRAARGVGGPRRAADEVEHVPFAAARDQHEADAARARHERLDDVERGADGHRRVHRVAAGQQDFDAGHRRERMRGGDDGTATPRDESAAAARTAAANTNEACTITGDRQCGSTWRATMTTSETPSARAASTYIVSRITSTEPRTMRATRGAYTIPMATMTLATLGPSEAISAMARMMAGKAMSPSITRITGLSSRRQYPAQ